MDYTHWEHLTLCNPVKYFNVQWLGMDTQYLSSPTSLLLLSVEAAIRFKVQGFPAHATRLRACAFGAVAHAQREKKKSCAQCECGKW